MKQHLIDVKKTYPDYTMTTHKRLSFTGVDIDKVVNGKIAEHGGAVNTFDTLFEQGFIRSV